MDTSRPPYIYISYCYSSVPYGSLESSMLDTDATSVRVASSFFAFPSSGRICFIKNAEGSRPVPIHINGTMPVVAPAAITPPPASMPKKGSKFRFMTSLFLRIWTSLPTRPIFFMLSSSSWLNCFLTLPCFPPPAFGDLGLYYCPLVLQAFGLGL